jgi:hypothetical protein
MSKVNVTLKGVRLSFPNLIEPRIETDKSGKRVEKYDALFIMQKGDEAHRALEAAVEQVLREKWQGKVHRDALSQLCLHPGTKKPYDGFGEGTMYVSASSKTQPTLANRDRTPVNRAGVFYPGCYVVAYLTVSAMEPPGYGKQVNAYINAVQFLRDGEPLGAGKAMDYNELEDLGDEVAAEYDFL